MHVTPGFGSASEERNALRRISVAVNGEKVRDVELFLSSSGEAFFLEPEPGTQAAAGTDDAPRAEPAEDDEKSSIRRTESNAEAVSNGMPQHEEHRENNEEDEEDALHAGLEFDDDDASDEERRGEECTSDVGRISPEFELDADTASFRSASAKSVAIPARRRLQNDDDDAPTTPVLSRTGVSEGKEEVEVRRDEDVIGQGGDDEQLECPELEFSLCKSELAEFDNLVAEGDLAAQTKTSTIFGTKAKRDAVFDAHKIEYDVFARDMGILENPQLIVRLNFLGGKLSTWREASHAVALHMFGRALGRSASSMASASAATTVKEHDSKDIVKSSGNEETSKSWKEWILGFGSPPDRDHGLELGKGTPPLSNATDVAASAVATQSAAGTEAGPSIDADDTNAGRDEEEEVDFRKTLVPSSEILGRLPLEFGQNLLTFTVCDSDEKAEYSLHCYAFLYKWNIRLIVSDIDGTITKSDFRGIFFSQVLGLKSFWSQHGLAKLYSAIERNGYKFMYLSARAIAQSSATRDYLQSVVQDGDELPTGPVIMSPDGLIPSLYREIIQRKPHEFKISCLEHIQKLFPEDFNPFYAGFGNRSTDEVSYSAAGIESGKIFTLNSRGQVSVYGHNRNASSIHDLNESVNDIFPAIINSETDDCLVSTQYNDFNWWKRGDFSGFSDDALI